MTRHRILVLLLLLVAADFAVPYEPTARGVFELEDEQEAVRSDGRRAQSPEAAASRPSTTQSVARQRIVRRAAERQADRRPTLNPVRRIRADLASPPSSTEDH